MSEAADLFREMLKAHRRTLSPRARERSRHPRRSSLPRWLYPSSAERRYAREAKALMKSITDEGTRRIKAGLESWIVTARGDRPRADSWFSDVRSVIEQLGGMIVEADVSEWLGIVALLTSRFNRTQHGKQIRHVLGQDIQFAEPWLPDVLDAWTSENFVLIRSLSEDYIKRLNTIVSSGVEDGLTYNAITEQIEGLADQITGPRARLLARDQVGKLNGRLTRRRQQDVGVTAYEWATANDERVRSSHQAINGALCRWEDDTVYSTTEGRTWRSRPGRMPRAHPGMEIQCRCTSYPFFDAILEEVDHEIDGEAA